MGEFKTTTKKSNLVKTTIFSFHTKNWSELANSQLWCCASSLLFQGWKYWEHLHVSQQGETMERGSELVSSPPTVHAQQVFPISNSLPRSPVMLLCFWGPRYSWQLWASTSSSQSTSLSSQPWTCKQHTFLLPFRNCSNVLLCEKPIYKSCQSRNGFVASLPVSWIPQRHNFVLETLLWLPGYNFQAQIKMTAMIIKGQLYLKDPTIFCVKDRAICVILTILWR